MYIFSRFHIKLIRTIFLAWTDLDSSFLKHSKYWKKLLPCFNLPAIKYHGSKVERREPGRDKHNPVEALKLFQSKPDEFDLVITDMTMPQMTGVKLSERLMDVRFDIPVIICTGHSYLIDEEKAKTLGIAAYVMKPIVMSGIAKTIRKVLDEVKASTQESLPR